MSSKITIVRAAEANTSPIGHQSELCKKVIFNHEVVPGLLQLATAFFKAGDEIKAHAHETMTEVFYVAIGKMTIKTDEWIDSLATGDTIAVKPGITHGFHFQDDTQLLYFGLASGDFPRSISRCHVLF
ncbi:MAG: cupin domain-containing protein [Desulfatitalea sp.]|nr:cupin domain-containing protein [Desulfatitalea sp.]